MKQLVIAVLAAFSMVSCQKILENEAEVKYEENEREIQSYISGSNTTFQKSATGLYYNFLTIKKFNCLYKYGVKKEQSNEELYVM